MAGVVKNYNQRIKEKNSKDPSTDPNWQKPNLNSFNKTPSVEYEDRYNMSDNDTMYDWKFKQLVNEQDRILKENRLIRQELEETSGRSVNPRSPNYLKSKNLESKLKSNNQKYENIHDQQIDLVGAKDIYENFTMAQYKNSLKKDNQGKFVNPLQTTPNLYESKESPPAFDEVNDYFVNENNQNNNQTAIEQTLTADQKNAFGGYKNNNPGSGVFEGEGAKDVNDAAADFTKINVPISSNIQTQVQPQYKDLFKRNILHDYDTVTYNFQLSMLSEQGTRSAQEHIIKANYSGAGWSKWSSNNFDKIIIAETGSTVLSIADAQINAVAGPINNGKRLTGAVDFQLNIVQPLNASFTDTLVNAAMALGLPDGLKATYLLELKFIGRDPETGDIVDPIPTTQRQFLIEIIAVEATVDTRGASYNVRAVRAGDKGMMQNTYQTDRPVQLVNLKTVNDLIKSTAETMNLNELDKLAIEKGILDEYYIKLDDYASASIGNDPILDTETLEKVLTNKSFDEKDDSQFKMFRIAQGTSIDRIIEFGISHSKKLQKLAKGLKDDADADSSNSDDIDKYVKRIFKIKVDTKNIAWDVLRNDYAREYHYTISLFPTIRPEILPGVWGDWSKVAEEKIKALINGDLGESKSRPYKALSKRYDYLFTGLNDKVLRFDIKYNNQFFFALHSYRGIYSKLSNDVKDKITKTSSTLTKFKEQQKTLRSAWSEYLSAKSDNIGASDETKEKALGPAWDKFASERTELINLYVEGVENNTFEGDVETARGLQLTDAAGPFQTNKKTLSKNSMDNEYSTDPILNQSLLKDYAELIDREQVVNAIEASEKPFQIMWGAIPDDFRGNFNNEDGSPGKGHLDAVIEASLADFEADLVSMDMDIKGDPFWLESERDFDNEDTASLYEGENYLLFRAITSAGEPDPETGLANPNREGKEQMLNGVYAVVQINNSFTGGQFIQNIKGVKEAFITDISILEQFKEK